jgi:hypothetical protein
VTKNEILIIYLILIEGADFYSANFTGAGNSSYNRQFGLEIRQNSKWAPPVKNLVQILQSFSIENNNECLNIFVPKSFLMMKI